MASIRSEISEPIKLYLAVLTRQGIRVDRAYLFGSRLRGSAGEHSDIDLLVISADFDGRQAWERAEITGTARYETFKATGESVEALPRSPDEIKSSHPASFLAGVLKEAELIYEADPGSRGESLE